MGAQARDLVLLQTARIANALRNQFCLYHALIRWRLKSSSANLCLSCCPKFHFSRLFGEIRVTNVVAIILQAIKFFLIANF